MQAQLPNAKTYSSACYSHIEDTIHFGLQWSSDSGSIIAVISFCATPSNAVWYFSYYEYTIPRITVIRLSWKR